MISAPAEIYNHFIVPENRNYQYKQTKPVFLELYKSHKYYRIKISPITSWSIDENIYLERIQLRIQDQSLFDMLVTALLHDNPLVQEFMLNLVAANIRSHHETK